MSCDPAEGLGIINKLFSVQSEDDIVDSLPVEIRTQITGEEGRPDIEVIIPGWFRGYVEVKHSAVLGENQLERYYADMMRHNEPEKTLVLLTRTRSDTPQTTLSAEKYRHVRWYEIYNWLESLPIDDEVGQFLIRNFNSFLEAIGMSMKKVTWEYMQGVPALLNLTKMIEAALRAGLPDQSLRRTAGWSWRGFYLTGTDLWCGFRFDAPLEIVIENNTGNDPTYKRSFDLEEGHFFSLSKDEQYETVLEFVRDAYQDAMASEEVTPSSG